MHIQIVNFNLKGLSDQEFRKFGEETAATFAALPGLISKVYLADPATNTYGGVYTWRSRADMENYLKTDLYKGLVNHPNLENVTSRDFGVIEAPTRIARGLVAVAT